MLAAVLQLHLILCLELEFVSPKVVPQGKPQDTLALIAYLMASGQFGWSVSQLVGFVLSRACFIRMDFNFFLSI